MICRPLSLFDSLLLPSSNRLGSHLSPSGTECYITSDMFYVEVQLDTSGQLVDVKVAHQGENPTVSNEGGNNEKSLHKNRQYDIFLFSSELS